MPINFLLVCKSRVSNRLLFCCRSFNPALVKLSLFVGELEAGMNWWKVKSIWLTNKQANKQQQQQPLPKTLLEAAKLLPFSKLCHQIFSNHFSNATATRVMNFPWISFPLSTQHCHLFLLYMCHAFFRCTLRFPSPPFVHPSWWWQCSMFRWDNQDKASLSVFNLTLSSKRDF